MIFINVKDGHHPSLLVPSLMHNTTTASVVYYWQRQDLWAKKRARKKLESKTENLNKIRPEREQFHAKENQITCCTVDKTAAHGHQWLPLLSSSEVHTLYGDGDTPCTD